MNDRERLEAIVKVVRQYLPPDGICIREAMGEIIKLVDPMDEDQYWGKLSEEHLQALKKDMRAKAERYVPDLPTHNSNLRKAAERALEALEWISRVNAMDYEYQRKAQKPMQALRQALATEEALDRMVAENQRLGLYDDGPAVKTYAGGKPNYCTPEVTPEVTPDVDNAYTKLDTTAGVLHKENT